MSRQRVCWSVDSDKLEAFQQICDAWGLPYSHVIDELMDYFVRIETPQPAATIPVDQPPQQERPT